MKYCRFSINSQTHYGSVEERNGELWIAALAPAPSEDLAYRLALEETGAGNFDFAPMPLSAAQLLPPVTPSKIVCVGRNYRAHVRELGSEMPTEPLIFLKPPSSLLAPGAVVPSFPMTFHSTIAPMIRHRSFTPPDPSWRLCALAFPELSRIHTNVPKTGSLQAITVRHAHENSAGLGNPAQARGTYA